ncbi:MAG: hypothetical protein DRO52_01405 [Candidatus Hecatellales archaeon]|nr:MAG: hypothetical protein DRO52_01405 [Candidatus Hecatellales archaeon]
MLILKLLGLNKRFLVGGLGRPVVSLLTDFGLKDSYVAEMKAVILSLCPRASLVDITHEVEPFNLRAAAYLLSRAAPWFPRGTVHLAIVDPGVGGGRKPLIVEAEGAVFVGPDNGILLPAARKLGLKRVYEIRSEKLPKRFTEVFHGRDIFAPTAARLACGVKPSSLGVETSEFVEEVIPQAKILEGKIRGEIVYADRFGNLVTNIGRKLLEAFNVKPGSLLKVSFKERKALTVRFLQAYSQAEVGELLTLIGSWGTLEVSANQAKASEKLKVGVGEELWVEKA